MRTLFLLCALSLVSLSASATEKMYAVAGVAFNDMDFSEQDESGVGYTLAIGHQFHPQWYVEAGYLKLMDDLSDTDGLEGDALYLAVLGKASSRQGELFYKLGVARADIQGREAALADDSCALGSAQGGTCYFDEGVIAGLVGLGFDYHLTMQSMVRLEYTYLGGEESFSSHWVNLAFRYNFN
ncbi:outer membrane beta-barrel protein [Alteromonas sp. CYL-A6]|uniref:outer membrane beta-barrel protein n=1 Tax=Alteromonas nitratireducens TaxID=3390813 RepID=UPI0034BE52ED